MKQVTLDYIFKTSSKMLFKRLSTPSGLSEWFADDVTVRDGEYTFKWKDNFQTAKYQIDRRKQCIKFDWIDEDKEFLEFKIEESTISDEITLLITDFIEDYEDEDDGRDFWDDLIKRFKQKIGLK